MNLSFISGAKYKLRGYIAELKGEREEMQDAHVIMDDFGSEFDRLPDGV